MKRILQRKETGRNGDHISYGTDGWDGRARSIQLSGNGGNQGGGVGGGGGGRGR